MHKPNPKFDKIQKEQKSKRYAGRPWNQKSIKTKEIKNIVDRL